MALVPMKELAVVMLHSSCNEVSPLPVWAEPLQWDAINTTTQSGERAWSCCQDADWLRHHKVSSAVLTAAQSVANDAVVGSNGPGVNPLSPLHSLLYAAAKGFLLRRIALAPLSCPGLATTMSLYWSIMAPEHSTLSAAFVPCTPRCT